VPSADSALKKWADPKNCALLLRGEEPCPALPDFDLSPQLKSDHLHTWTATPEARCSSGSRYDYVSGNEIGAHHWNAVAALWLLELEFIALAPATRLPCAALPFIQVPSRLSHPKQTHPTSAAWSATRATELKALHKQPPGGLVQRVTSKPAQKKKQKTKSPPTRCTHPLRASIASTV